MYREQVLSFLEEYEGGANPEPPSGEKAPQSQKDGSSIADEAA